MTNSDPAPAPPWRHLESLTSVGVFAAPADAAVRPWTVPPWVEVVELLTGGEVDFVVDGTERRFGAGTIFWHRAGQSTIWKTPVEAPYRCIVFHFRVASTGTCPAPRVGVWDGMAEGWGNFARECLELFHSRPGERGTLALYAYGTLLRRATEGGAEASRRPPQLERALAFLERHPGHSPDMAELCRRAGAGRAQLFRQFRRYLSTTPHRYLTERRMARARLLLAGTPLGIKEVAYRCGFSNLEVFYRRFKAHNAMTPLEYRRAQHHYELDADG